MSLGMKHAVLALGLSFVMAPPATAADIVVDNAWIRSAPPGATVLGGYLTIHNNGDKEITLLSASSDVAATTEIHQSETSNGMTHMRAVKEVKIAGRSQLKFEPGSYHLMLMTPKRDLKPGDKATFTLNFADKTAQTVTAVVRDDMADDSSHDDSHDMSKHHH